MLDKMAPIRVTSEKEFERLLDHMASEAHRAADHWHLYKGLENANRKYAPEMYESWTFWSFTLRAHYDDVLFRLARLYDQHDSGLSLKKFLLTVKDNLLYFSEDAVRRRLRENPYVEGLLRKVNLGTLGGDIRRVSAGRDPLVSHLCKLRNESLSHVQPNPVRLGGLVPWLPAKEVERLLVRACRILNRYSLTYRASLYSAQVSGANDFTRVLDSVRVRRDALIAEQEKVIRGATAGALGRKRH